MRRGLQIPRRPGEVCTSALVCVETRLQYQLVEILRVVTKPMWELMCRTRRDERWCRIKINPAFPELTAQIFSEFWRLTGSFRASILP